MTMVNFEDCKGRHIFLDEVKYVLMYGVTITDSQDVREDGHGLYCSQCREVAISNS